MPSMNWSLGARKLVLPHTSVPPAPPMFTFGLPEYAAKPPPPAHCTRPAVVPRGRMKSSLRPSRLGDATLLLAKTRFVFGDSAPVLPSRSVALSMVVLPL